MSRNGRRFIPCFVLCFACVCGVVFFRFLLFRFLLFVIVVVDFVVVVDDVFGIILNSLSLAESVQ